MLNAVRFTEAIHEAEKVKSHGRFGHKVEHLERCVIFAKGRIGENHREESFAGSEIVGKVVSAENSAQLMPYI